jgi:hypothetical protein
MTTDNRAEFVAGLRELADYLESHPDLPVPFRSATVGPYLGYPSPETDESRRAEVDRIAAVLGVDPEWNYDSTHYTASRAFGPIAYQATAIGSEDMARHKAWTTYADAVQPEVTR